MRIVALIPARAGSKRIPGKNTKLLAGKPLIQWTIDAAVASGIFGQVLVCTDAEMALNTAGSIVDLVGRRPSADDEPDIAWVRDCLPMDADAFAILRLTSPFRTAGTIRRAWETFLANQPADSLRAIRSVREHPGKMWRIAGNRLVPLLPFDRGGVPWHSSPTQTLPPVFVQTASLEIAWTRTVTEQGSISGASIVPFSVEGPDAFDINTPDDWARAEELAPSLLAGV